MSDSSLRQVVLLSLVLGAVIRIIAAGGDLWLDEIWSLNLAAPLTSPLEVFRIRIDNNHILNSLWLYFIGPDRPAWLYRFLSLGASIAALWPALRIGRRMGGAAGTLFPVLCALSAVLITITTEARGYGVMVLGVLALWDHVEGRQQRGRLPNPMVVLLVAGSGTLAHLSFALFYLPLVVWQILTASARARLSGLAVHIPALAGLGLLYALHIRYLPPGSGPLVSYLDALVSTLSVGAGGPELPATGPAGIAALGAAVLFLVLIVRGLVVLARGGDRRWILGLFVVFLMPFAVLLLLEPRILVARYLLAPLIMALFLAAHGLGALAEDGRVGRYIAAVLLCLAVLGNALHLTRLARHHRGEYRAAVSFMSAGGASTVVWGDHDFRNSTVVTYHARALGRELRYLAESDRCSAEPNFFLAEDASREAPPRTLAIEACGGVREFQLVRSFPHALLSGTSWHLYRPGKS